MTPTPEKLFEEFFRFCYEHGGTLRHHVEFEGRAVELRAAMSASEQARQRAEDKLRSEFRCRGLTDAEIASEFAALAQTKETPAA